MSSLGLRCLQGLVSAGVLLSLLGASACSTGPVETGNSPADQTAGCKATSVEPELPSDWRNRLDEAAADRIRRSCPDGPGCFETISEELVRVQIVPGHEALLAVFRELSEG